MNIIDNAMCDELIEKCRELYGNDIIDDKYTPIVVRCKKHGLYYCHPYNLLHGPSCPGCIKEQCKIK